MKILFGTVMLVCAAASTAAFAASEDEIMAGYYGNTFYVTDASGTKHMQYRADHTYMEVDQQGHAVKGTWAIKDDKMCEKPDGGADDCSPIRAGHKAGDSWTGGGGKKLEIRAGIQ